MEIIDGKLVVLRAKLTDRWKWWRFCSCSAGFGQLWPILTPLYYCIGMRSREEEAASFDLTLTTTAIQCV